MSVKYKPLPPDPRGFCWMQKFCESSKCEFWAMRIGKTILPFSTTESDVADKCLGNCQKSAMEFAQWLSKQNLPTHNITGGKRTAKTGPRRR